MIIVQLMASPFLGGPERQAVGLARHLPAGWRAVFLTFAEGGRCQALLTEVHKHGLEGRALRGNFPRVFRAAREVADELKQLRADVVCCHGYKPDVIGWLAARRAGVPAVAVAHGWTAVTLKVRLNEALDRLVMRRMDAVVCVSEAMAEKVRNAGVAAERAVVIRNAVELPDGDPDPEYRRLLESFFPKPPRLVVGAAGRFSPEKGFGVLIDAASSVLRERPDAGFVLFGDGPLRPALERQVAELGLRQKVVLPGFRADLVKFLPHLDLFALSSFTEGLPVAVLEALAVGVPVVATAVGGTPEAVEDGVCGRLASPGDPAALASGIAELLADPDRRRAMGEEGRRRVRERFTFAAQAEQYRRLFESLARGPS